MQKLILYIVNLFLPRIVKDLLDRLFTSFEIKKEIKEQKEKVDKASDKLDEVIKKPEATEKEKKDAFKDYLNNLPK